MFVRLLQLSCVTVTFVVGTCSFGADSTRATDPGCATFMLNTSTTPELKNVETGVVTPTNKVAYRLSQIFRSLTSQSPETTEFMISMRVSHDGEDLVEQWWATSLDLTFGGANIGQVNPFDIPFLRGLMDEHRVFRNYDSASRSYSRNITLRRLPLDPATTEFSPRIGLEFFATP